MWTRLYDMQNRMSIFFFICLILNNIYVSDLFRKKNKYLPYLSIPRLYNLHAPQVNIFIKVYLKCEIILLESRRHVLSDRTQ